MTIASGLGADLAAEIENQQRRRGAVERYGWSVNDWATSVGISRASVYNILKTGKLESVTYGGKRLILTHPRDFLAGLAAPKGEAA